MRGALLMIAAVGAFTVNDALMKALLGHVPLFQAQFLRGLAVLLLLALASGFFAPPRLDLSRRDWTLCLARSFAEAVSAVLYLEGLSRIPLPNATAILQSVPLFLTLAAAIFLKEPIGWRRLGAILVGFLGVLLIVRPGPEGFSPGALYVSACVVTVVLRELCTRKLSPEVPSMTAALTMGVVLVIFSGAGAAVSGEWRPLVTADILRIGAASVAVSLGYVLSIGAIRLGDLSVVGPFRYTGMVWSLLLGLAFFGVWPDPLTLTGAGIVIAAGLFTIYREHVSERAASRLSGTIAAD